MKELEITFFMKNNQQILARMNGNKEDVLSEVNFAGFSGAKSFGNHVINMDEVLAVEIQEGHDVPEFSDEIDPKTIFNRGN